jgi:hypothetical protein
VMEVVKSHGLLGIRQQPDRARQPVEGNKPCGQSVRANYCVDRLLYMQ